MKTTPDKILNLSAIAVFKQMIRLSRSSLQIIEAEASLSPKHCDLLNTSQLCNLQLSRICSMWEYLTDGDLSFKEDNLMQFEVENLANEVANRFERTISGYLPVKTNVKIALKNDFSIALDKTGFELAVLNLLYCILKTNTTLKAKPILVTIYVTENKNNIIFHIRDNSSPINPSIIDKAFSTKNLAGNTLDDCSYTDLIELSLRVAQKAVIQMQGTLTHVPLKSGNRFDVSLPKFPKTSPTNPETYLLHSTTRYIPTSFRYAQTFADICLEGLLSKVIDSFGSLEDLLL